VSPERDDDRDEDEREEFASRSIFSAGWFRAVLVLTVVAIVVVISLPYLLHWFEPSPPARVAKPAEPLKPAPSATPPPAVAPAPALAPAAPVAVPPEVKAAPPAAFATAPKVVGEKALPPVSSEPARKATPEKAPVTPPAENAVTKAPARTATERTRAKAPESPLAKSGDKPATPTRVVAKADAPSRPAAEAASGSYWIQLGAFKEKKNADALAQTLRDAGFPIQVTPIQRGSGGATLGETQRHELFVTEAGLDKVNAALKGRGRGQLAAGGIAVKPAFSLQEAMTVSKLLTDEGLKVVIRPAGGLATASQGEGTLHAVRAGGYSNRTSALAARDELAAKGHQGFVAEGPAK
jgi:cell division septation protein DedD